MPTSGLLQLHQTLDASAFADRTTTWRTQQDWLRELIVYDSVVDIHTKSFVQWNYNEISGSCFPYFNHEAPPKALDINVKSSAELNSVLGSVGMFNTIKKPLYASPLEASLSFSIITLLAVILPESDKFNNLGVYFSRCKDSMCSSYCCTFTKLNLPKMKNRYLWPLILRWLLKRTC